MPSTNAILHQGAPAWNECRRRALQQIREVAVQARSNGNFDQLHSLIESYLDSNEVKAALIDRIGRAHPWAAVADPLGIAAAMNLRSLPRGARTGRWWLRPKPNGDTRRLYSLSLPLRVGHSMVGDVLQQVHAPRPHIGDWSRRGPSYHIQQLCEGLRGDSVVLLADVRNCYESVQPDAIYRIEHLPSDLVEACFDPRRIRLRAPSRGQLISMRYVSEGMGRHGLMTGSPASSILWAIMIDDLPGTLPAGVRANTYADNVAIACRSTQECDEVEAALIEYFVNHPAGPFVLRTWRPNVELGFDHLGYEISRYQGKLHVCIKDSRLASIADRISREVGSRAELISDEDVELIGKICMSPWPMLSPDSRDGFMEEIRIECVRRNNTLTTRTPT
jgi:hypothetical protein